MIVMSKIESAAGYQFQQRDELLFDANIWIYLYAPVNPNHRAVKVYSTMFKKILNVQCRLFTDVLIVSEMVNRLARMKWDRSKYRHFKNFRDSSEFKVEAVHIASNVRQILRHCVRIESGFSLVDVESLLDAFEAGAYDFNDQIILEVCRRHCLTLVTHDGDFHQPDVTIVTANRNLLKGV